LSKREKDEREHKKTLLRLAKDHDKAREIENVQRYHMPLGKKVRTTAIKIKTKFYKS
jgi:pre-mRNA-splicing factor ATP-dependent RNA helicase DHX16